MIAIYKLKIILFTISLDKCKTFNIISQMKNYLFNTHLPIVLGLYALSIMLQSVNNECVHYLMCYKLTSILLPPFFSLTAEPIQLLEDSTLFLLS